MWQFKIKMDRELEIVQSVSIKNYKNRDKLCKSTKFGIHVLDEGI